MRFSFVGGRLEVRCDRRFGNAAGGRGELAEDVGQLAEAKAALIVATSEGEKTVEAFVADNVEKQGDASRQADALEQQLPKGACPPAVDADHQPD